MQRDISLDVIRVVACLMVICMHSPMPHEGWFGPLLSSLSYLTSPCIGLFFMVSGSLLLTAKPLTQREFLKKRFTKILVPIIFFSLLGKIFLWLGLQNNENDILWFMYTLAGLYLLTPILRKYLQTATRREIAFYLLLWGMGLCIPLVKLFMPVNESDTSWLYYFHGYVGYYVLGYYLQTTPEEENSRKRNICFVMLFLVLSVLLPLLLFILKIKVDFYSLFWYLSITVALCCVMWWKVLKKIAVKITNTRLISLIVEVSKLSFGIYLTHILVLRNFLWEMSWIKNLNDVLQIIVCTLLTFIISVAISYAMSKIKYVKALIGF